MKKKHNQGSAIVLTLLIFTVLLIFSSFTITFMVNENKQSIYQENKTQAYYIARSGAIAVEAAIMKMNQQEVNKLNSELDKGTVIVDNEDYKVKLTKEEDRLIITSIGKVNNAEQQVEKVMKVESIGSEINIEHSIYSLGTINISNGTVVGDIAANHSITIPRGNPSIKGDIYILEGQSFTSPGKWKENWNKAGYTVKELEGESNYESFKFPTFSQNNSKTDFRLSGNDTATIYESGDYNNFTIESNTKLYIDASNKDISLNMNNFNLTNGQIIIKGNNKVTFYSNQMSIGSGSTINYYEEKKDKNKVELVVGGDSKQVDIYYKGINKLEIGGSQKIRGNLYIEKAPLTITGSGSVVGNVYSNGGDIELSGSGDIAKGLLYAPNSNVSFTGSGKVNGALIGKSINISGAGTVIYDSSYMAKVSIPGSDTSATIKITPLHFQ